MFKHTLVPMGMEHVGQVAALEAMYFSRPWKRADLIAALEDEASVFVVAEDSEEGVVLGYVGLKTVLNEGYINNVAVAEQFRGQGVADDLIDAIVEFGREKLAFLTLEVRPSNRAAISLYAKHGFVEVGRRKDYYNDPTEDALLMTLTFSEEQ